MDQCKLPTGELMMRKSNSIERLSKLRRTHSILAGQFIFWANENVEMQFEACTSKMLISKKKKKKYRQSGGGGRIS